MAPHQQQQQLSAPRDITRVFTFTMSLQLLALLCLSTAPQCQANNLGAPSWHPAKLRTHGGRSGGDGGGGGGGGWGEQPPPRHEARARQIQNLHSHRNHRPAPRKPPASARAKAALLKATEAASPKWVLGEEGLGTWDTCDRCDQCILDDVPQGQPTPKPEPNADGIVHCKKCLGCSVVLSRMKEFQPMLGKKVKVFAGASGAAVLKGVTASHGSVFVKVWCGLKVGRCKMNPPG